MARGDADRLPLVLLPGTLCDSRLWQNQVEHLSDRTIPRVHDISRDDSIGAIARRVLAETPARFLLAGLSMGGMVAFEIMRLAPERVLGLALLDTSPTSSDRELIEQWNREIMMAQRGGFEDFVEDRWIPSLIAAGGSRAPALRDVIRGMAHATGPEGFVRQTRARMTRPDSWPSLPNIACPTIVLGGHDDSMCPPDLARSHGSRNTTRPTCAD